MVHYDTLGSPDKIKNLLTAGVTDEFRTSGPPAVPRSALSRTTCSPFTVRGVNE